MHESEVNGRAPVNWEAKRVELLLIRITNRESVWVRLRLEAEDWRLEDGSGVAGEPFLSCCAYV